MNWFGQVWKQFKEFAIKGNAIELAVALIIGAAFGAIVNSLVNDVIMPPIGLLTGGVDFKDVFVQLNHREHVFATLAEAKAAGDATIGYGVFLNNVIDFLIVAFVIFLLIRAANKMKRAPAPAAPSTKECPFCHTNIPLAATRCPNCTSNLQ